MLNKKLATSCLVMNWQEALQLFQQIRLKTAAKVYLEVSDL